MATVGGKLIMCTADARELLNDPAFMVAVKTMLANITLLPVTQVQLNLFMGTSLCSSSQARLLFTGGLRGLQSLTSALEGEYACSFPPSSSGEEPSVTKARAAMKRLSSKSQSELTLLLRETAQRHASLNSAKLPTVSAGLPTLTVQQFVTSTSSAAVASGLDTMTVIQIVATIFAVLVSCCVVVVFWWFYGDRTIRQSMLTISGKDGRPDQYRHHESVLAGAADASEKQQSLNSGAVDGQKSLKQVSPEPEPELQDSREEEAVNNDSLRSSAEVKHSKQSDAVMLDLNRHEKSWPPVPRPKIGPRLVPTPSDNPPGMAVYDLPIKVLSAKGDTYVSTKVVMSGRPGSAPASGPSRNVVSFEIEKRPYSAAGAKRDVRRNF